MVKSEGFSFDKKGKVKRALGEKFKGVDIELGRKLKAADEKEKIKV